MCTPQVKLWSSRSWRCLKVCAGHEGKVMAADLCPEFSGRAAAASGAGDADMAEAGEPQQQLPGGVGVGGAYAALVGSVSYDRTIKMWAPEAAGDGDGSSSGSGDSSDSEGGSEGGSAGADEQDGMLIG